ncbi:MAG TPA: hypothetical protein VH854_17065 [Thermoanaerobaculia bacterium]|nr:hypothetical protein [Thermoanaerobaculia bacterium]
MHQRALVFLFGICLAGSIVGQTPQRATVILGAGRAGSWDTRISITNTDANPIAVLVTTQPDRSACVVAACTDLAQATIPGQGTFVLPSIPDPLHPGVDPRPPISTSPQSMYVLSPADQKAPSVSAVAFDAASSCGRMTTLQVLPFERAFNYGDIVFSGISRGDGRYANLILTLDPFATDVKSVGVGVADANGSILWEQQFELAPGVSIMLVDVLAALGVESLDGGSIRLSRFFIPNSYDFTKYTATVTMVEPDRVSTVNGTVDPLLDDSQ